MFGEGDLGVDEIDSRILNGQLVPFVAKPYVL